jgi:drug/metabolite transporter (DMT)-like permease
VGHLHGLAAQATRRALDLVILYALAGAFNLPFFLWEHWSGSQLQPTLETGLAVLYVAIFPSVLAYTFYLRGVELIGGQRSGAMIHLVPLFGVLLSVTFLQEPLRLFHLAGFALILGGVTLAARKA